MEFADSTIHSIGILNNVLDSIGVPRLFENPDFVVDQDSLGFYSVIIKIAPENRRATQLTLFIEGDSIMLDVCGIDEAFIWTDKNMFTSGETVTDFFMKLFTSYVLVESCGFPNLKSRMYLFSKEGDLIAKYALRGFVQKFSGWDCDKSLFFPLY